MKGKQKMKTTIPCSMFAALALSSAVHAVSPPPDGGYPNFNTAEGDLALQHVTRGALNTAIGYQALYVNTSGNYNTAIGEDALYGNFTGSDNTAIGYSALVSNDADNNTADGANALTRNTSGA